MRQDLLHRARTGTHDASACSSWVDSLVKENNHLREAGRLGDAERLIERAMLWVVDLMASYHERPDDLNQWYTDARAWLGWIAPASPE